MGGGSGPDDHDKEDDEKYEKEYADREIEPTEETQQRLNEFATDEEGPTRFDPANVDATEVSFGDGGAETGADTDESGGGDGDTDKATGTIAGRGAGAGAAGGAAGSTAAGSPTGGTGEDEPTRMAADLGSTDITPGEFARRALSEGATADRHMDRGHADYDQMRAINPNDGPEGHIGGWNEYAEADKVARTSLNDVEGADGFTTDHKELVELASGEIAFATDYSECGLLQPVTGSQRMSEATAYTFRDALGMRVPEYTYDTESDTAVFAAAGEPTEETVGVDEASAERLQRVDRDEFLDQMAVAALTGNWDLKPDNVHIGEDGSVTPIDFDRCSQVAISEPDLVTNVDRGRNTLRKVARLNDDFRGGVVSPDRIIDRACELADQMVETGTADMALDAVSETVEAMPANSDAVDRIESNINVAASVEYSYQSEE